MSLPVFFEPSRHISTYWKQYLVFGVVITWLAGIGRYWDNPRAHLFQHLGLGSLNLEHVVFNIMAGNDPDTQSGNDQSYLIVLLLSLFSTLLLPVLVIAYGLLVYNARQAKRE